MEASRFAKQRDGAPATGLAADLLMNVFERFVAALNFPLLPISAQAQGQLHNLVFAEFSDSALTATLDGRPSGLISLVTGGPATTNALPVSPA